MRFYDITLSVSGRLPVYPGDPPVRVIRTASLKQGDPFNLSKCDFSAHTGTHVDAPLHFLEGGAGADLLDPEVLCGPCYVAELFNIHSVCTEDLEQAEIPAGVQRLLLKTDNTRRQLLTRKTFAMDYTSLTPDGAQWLLDRGIRLVGIDAFSISPVSDPAPVHEALLRRETVIVEGLDLRGISAGFYTLFCLPLKLEGCDGAPARVLLKDREAMDG